MYITLLFCFWILCAVCVSVFHRVFLPDKPHCLPVKVLTVKPFRLLDQITGRDKFVIYNVKTIAYHVLIMM
jgi:hypothetical protein